MENEFQKRAEIVRKFVEQRRSLVLRAQEVMSNVVAEQAENHGDLIVGTLKRYEACENCIALMAIIEELISPEHEGNA